MGLKRVPLLTSEQIEELAGTAIAEGFYSSRACRALLFGPHLMSEGSSPQDNRVLYQARLDLNHLALRSNPEVLEHWLEQAARMSTTESARATFEAYLSGLMAGSRPLATAPRLRRAALSITVVLLAGLLALVYVFFAARRGATTLSDRGAELSGPANSGSTWARPPSAVPTPDAGTHTLEDIRTAWSRWPLVTHSPNGAVAPDAARPATKRSSTRRARSTGERHSSGSGSSPGQRPAKSPLDAGVRSDTGPDEPSHSSGPALTRVKPTVEATCVVTGAGEVRRVPFASAPDELDTECRSRAARLMTSSVLDIYYRVEVANETIASGRLEDMDPRQ